MSAGMSRLGPETTCSRCRRPYFTETEGENGLCCICNRDDAYVARFGPGWRRLVRVAR